MTPDRRGEAHLWLLLEEALLHVRRGEVEPWEAWRNYRAVADALVVAGAVPAEVGDALVGELDDALAVRGVVPAAAFAAAPWPEVDVVVRDRPVAPASAAPVWLEAEVERHLDLFASFGAAARTRAADDLLRILRGPVRAFSAVGLLDQEGGRILDEVAATLIAVGVPLDPASVAEAGPRDRWVEFLQSEPQPIPVPHQVEERRDVLVDLGRLGGALLWVEQVAWSPAAVEVAVAVRARPAAGTTRGPAWHARVVDAGGRLHLGQPLSPPATTTVLRFALRPGLDAPSGPVVLRITRGVACVEAEIVL